MPIADIPEALLQTIVRQITLLLFRGANSDLDAARKAAIDTLLGYAPKTEAELRLAARIVAFSLQAVEALAQAAHPEMPMARVLRLRSGAVSLSREAQKAERQLETLQENRRAGQPEPAQAPPPPDSPRIGKTTALITENNTISAYAKAHGLTWTQAYRQRQRERTLAERQRRQQAPRIAGSEPVQAMA